MFSSSLFRLIGNVVSFRSAFAPTGPVETCVPAELAFSVRCAFGLIVHVVSFLERLLSAGGTTSGRAGTDAATSVLLGAKQVGILQESARRSGSLLFRNELIHAVCGADANTNSKSLDQYLYMLRGTYRESGIDLANYVTPALRVGWRVAAHASAAPGVVNPP